MKNTIKLFGIITLVAVIGFSMVACDDGSDNGGGNNDNNSNNNGDNGNNVQSITISLASLGIDEPNSFTLTLTGAETWNTDIATTNSLIAVGVLDFLEWTPFPPGVSNDFRVYDACANSGMTIVRSSETVIKVTINDTNISGGGGKGTFWLEVKEGSRTIDGRKWFNVGNNPPINRTVTRAENSSKVLIFIF